MIQKAIAGALCAAGIECQQEVVLPVLQKDVFVGHNRLDIVAVWRKGEAREVLIIELKTLNDMASEGKIPQRVRAQCVGYVACARGFFGSTATIHMYLVNVHVAPSAERIVRVFDICPPPHLAEASVPTPFRKKGAYYYEIEQVLKHRRRAGCEECLVWWKGYALELATWEPLENIPVLLIGRPGGPRRCPRRRQTTLRRNLDV